MARPPSAERSAGSWAPRAPGTPTPARRGRLSRPHPALERGEGGRGRGQGLPLQSPPAGGSGLLAALSRGAQRPWVRRGVAWVQRGVSCGGRLTSGGRRRAPHP